ncbi:GNAT family N-acetyltransferase [Microterricola viridarii]|uniref:N-acetyltransferase domain-containing protein n=1 Tax=Microterricola viridarii TaxID=412690 RepID=A0A109QYW5_9MICO|nr:GNAT family N-acetyltransferase [Microterricola viridarii]AMB59565.1 hypothetical protein AWU67_12590 [Microterricola viridarii]
MSRVSRRLNESESALSERHLREAFGITGEVTGPRRPFERYGLFEGDALVAQAFDIHMHTLIGGAELATAGIGNVTVAPEYRGSGAAQTIMVDTLTAARQRGALISTLFGAAPALYRSLGFELIARPKRWKIPMAAAAGIRVPAGLALRESTPDDAAALLDVYRQAARRSAFAVHRDESSWPEFSRVSVVHDGQRVLGYLAWRTETENDEVALRVEEVAALSPGAYAALMRSVASWSSVVRVATMAGVDAHPALAQLTGNTIPGRRTPYMLRVLDVAGALAGRQWARLDGGAVIAVDDEVFADNAGGWALAVAGGAMAVQPAAEADAGVRFTARGLAAWFSGSASVASIADAGHATIVDEDAAALLDGWAVLPTTWISENF